MGNKRRAISKASYIGSNGAEFKRVSLAFQICGFVPPHEETINGIGTGGGFVMNLIDPYLNSNELTEDQALMIIMYGLAHSKETLQHELDTPAIRPTLREVLGEREW